MPDSNTSMQMNFFESQDVARKKTGRLVLMFIAAVVMIVVSVYLVVGGAIVMTSSKMANQTESGWELLANPLLILAVCGGTLAIILLGTLYKLAMLKGGGRAVAEHLGGKLIHLNTSDPVEQKILNVVSEMAIASGVPCPPVYLMDKERGINAFAAGYAPEDAVIGVTRGCVEQLTRDELQGVIAHEFSHILNGDMRLNIRLMGVIHGILIIGIIGYTITRSMYWGSVGMRVGRSSNDKRGGQAAIAIIGIGLMAVGFVGTFFGNLIKSSVSRQREYLADASAVQFTRNPDGIGNALRRIGGHAKHASIEHPNAQEMSHMFFGPALTSGFAAVFSTHPPLEQRIKKVLPGWDGSFLSQMQHTDRAGAKGETRTGRSYRYEKRTSVQIGDNKPEIFTQILTGAAAAEAMGRMGGSDAINAEAATESVEHIGNPSQEHIDYARQLIDGIPIQIRTAAQDPWSARAVIYVLLLDTDNEQVRREQLRLIDARADRGVLDAVKALATELPTLNLAARLPLIEMAIAALRDLSNNQYEAFKDVVIALVAADQSIDLLEWTMQRMLLHHLAPQFGDAPNHSIRFYALTKLRRECAVLMSLLAHAGHANESDAKHAFDASMQVLGLDGVQMLPKAECRLSMVDQALEQLAAVAPKKKEPIIHAAVTCVTVDGTITLHEAEVLRSISGALGCPMPPLLADQKLAG